MKIDGNGQQFAMRAQAGPVAHTGKRLPTHRDDTDSPYATHTVQQGETLDSIAEDHDVSVEQLASANDLSIHSHVQEHDLLILPDNARITGDDDTSGLSPEQRTEQAYLALQDAQQAHQQQPSTQSQTELNAAEQEFVQAVEMEIAARLDLATLHIPSHLQARNPDQLIESFGTSISQRYPDAGVQPLIDQAVSDYQFQHEATSLIPTFFSEQPPAYRLQQLALNLAGQPDELIDAVISDPHVQEWVEALAADLGGPLSCMAPDALSAATDEATRFANDLALITADMPAAMVEAIVAANMPSIEAMAQTDAGPNANSFGALTQVLNRLDGGDPEAQNLINQIANAYVDGPSGSHVSFLPAVAGNPQLAMAMAALYSERGDEQALINAEFIIGNLELSAANLQVQLQSALSGYGDEVAEMNYLIASFGPAMTHEQQQAAIDEYVQTKGPEWQAALEAQQQALVADVQAMAVMMDVLGNPPTALNGELAVQSRATADGLAQNEQVQQAMQFATALDPAIFSGAQGAQAAEFLLSLEDLPVELTQSIAQAAYLSPILGLLDGFDPSSERRVAQLTQALEGLVHLAPALGIDAAEMQGGINSLQSLAMNLAASRGTDADAIGQQIRENLQPLQVFSTGPMSVLVQTIGLGMATAALLSSTGQQLNDPSVSGTIDLFADTIGMSQGAGQMLISAGILDSSSDRVRQWVSGSSGLGRATGVLASGLSAVSSVVAAVEQYQQGDAVAGHWNLVAGGGYGVSTAAILMGSTALGAVGVGIVILAKVAVTWHEQTTQYEQPNNDFVVPYLENAGFSTQAATELANQSGQGYSAVPLLMQYATNKGYDMSNPEDQQAVVNWVNAMPVEDLRVLVGWLHQTVDDLEGHASQLGTDATVQESTRTTSFGTSGQVGEVADAPTSVGEIDYIIQDQGNTPLQIQN